MREKAFLMRGAGSPPVSAGYSPALAGEPLVSGTKPATKEPWRVVGHNARPPSPFTVTFTKPAPNEVQDDDHEMINLWQHEKLRGWLQDQGLNTG